VDAKGGESVENVFEKNTREANENDVDKGVWRGRRRQGERGGSGGRIRGRGRGREAPASGLKEMDELKMLCLLAR
jgi:hypothetical protein